MPVYEYVCDKCSRTTEALRRMADADAPQACEHCGGKKTHRAHSVFTAAAAGPAEQSMPMAPCGMPGGGGGHCCSGPGCCRH